MFNVVTPKKRKEFSDDLKQFFERCAIEHDGLEKDEYDHDQAIYVVCSHKKFGVIGGARLIPSNANPITSDLLKRIKFDPKKKVYELSRVFFHLPKDPKGRDQSQLLDLISRDFYQSFYESLKTISIAQKVHTFLTVLSEDKHNFVEKRGLWPFDKRAKIMSPYKDGKQYILGIMPMNSAMYEAFLVKRGAEEKTKFPMQL